jgi:hypothetical protein
MESNDAYKDRKRQTAIFYLYVSCSTSTWGWNGLGMFTLSLPVQSLQIQQIPAWYVGELGRAILSRP